MTRAMVASTVRGLRPTRDRVWRSADRRTTAFRLVNHGGIDGLDFTPRCSERVTFTLTVNGRAIDPQKIHLGGDDSHPAASTFTISRIPLPA